MGRYIEEMTWEEVKEALNEDTVVVLPIGGGSKEHGPHLPMGTDMYLAQYLADQMTENCDVLTLPCLNYAHFPAFVEWEGSINIESRHFIDVVKDICISYARFGVRKMIIMDFSFSAKPPLHTVSTEMNNEWGMKVAVVISKGDKVKKQVNKQKQGGHACENESSQMYYLYPELCKPELAVEDYSIIFPGSAPNGPVGIYLGHHMVTESGVNGNAPLATPEKGEKILAGEVHDLVYFTNNFIKYKPGNY